MARRNPYPLRHGAEDHLFRDVTVIRQGKRPRGQSRLTEDRRWKDPRQIPRTASVASPRIPGLIIRSITASERSWVYLTVQSGPEVSAASFEQNQVILPSQEI